MKKPNDYSYPTVPTAQQKQYTFTKNFMKAEKVSNPAPSEHAI